MAFFRGPNVVTNGLVLSLDAANVKSYPGSGTTWNDLSGNNNNATLVGSPAYSSTNNGQLYFTTSCNASIPLPQAASASVITVDMWVNWKSNAGGMFIGMTNYDVWTNGGTLGYNNGASNVVGINAATVTSLGLIGNYKHYTFIMNNSGLLSTNSIYINGVSQGTLTAVVGADGAIPGFATTITLNSWNSGGFMNDSYYSKVKIYNRLLSVTEIQQNYNAVKSRFNIS